MICSKAKLPMKSTISKLNMCYNQTCDISTLDGTSLKLVDKFTYLESSKCALYLLRANVHSVVGPGRLCSCILRRYFVLFFSDTAEWNDKYQIAYDKLKGMLAEKVTLAYSDLTRAYNLYTDASDYAIGAFLTQTLYYEDKGKEQENPIYFLSHKLSDTQTRWSTIKKETYAIHYALQKVNHYLHGAEFVIYSDHKPLEYLLNSPMQNRKIQL